ncbi:MAG: exodeoxyribonuclease III [Actinomycetota bacterium]
MRIATWNVNSLKARMPRVEEWLGYAQPDVLCMQETKLSDSAFPAMAFQTLGYEGVHHGEGRWNGVAILSRVGIDDPVPGFRDDVVPGDEARVLSATCGGVRVSTVYVPNGRTVGHEQWYRKLEWLERLRGHLDNGCDPGQPMLICGDFNIAPDDRDVWDASAVHGATHVSPEEREALGRLLDWGLVDVFRLHHDDGGLYSWWDYRAGNFHKKMGMRIDLMLATEPLAKASTWALIDRNARKGTAPSDHAPLLGAFDLDL